MKTEHSNDNYSEILQDLKNERMDWEFDSFLKEAEKVSPSKKRSKKTYLLPILGMAASVLLIVGALRLVNFMFHDTVKDSDNLVKNNILKQKQNGEIRDTLEINKKTMAILDSATKHGGESLSIGLQDDEKIMNQILPKKQRLKKVSKTYYVNTGNDERMADSTGKDFYRPSYVVINGQKIQSEKEALDVAEYSFMMLQEKCNKALAVSKQPAAIDE